VINSGCHRDDRDALRVGLLKRCLCRAAVDRVDDDAARRGGDGLIDERGEVGRVELGVVERYLPADRSRCRNRGVRGNPAAVPAWQAKMTPIDLSFAAGRDAGSTFLNVPLIAWVAAAS